MYKIIQIFRALNPDYEDGISAPRESHTSNKLPSARNVSLSVHRPSYSIDPEFTVMVAVFGQFLDHDITATALNQGQDNEPIDCCVEDDEQHPECFPVILGSGDPNFDLYNITCMNFVRSAPAPTERFGPRQQLNQVSAYIDGSAIYGYSAEKVESLRTRKFEQTNPIIPTQNKTMFRYFPFTTIVGNNDTAFVFMKVLYESPIEPKYLRTQNKNCPNIMVNSNTSLFEMKSSNLGFRSVR